MSEEIVNKVANSGLINFDLEEHYPSGQRQCLDLKDWLFEGIILKEKDFRQAVKAHDWKQYQGQHICIDCTTDAIVPVWAYMLIVTSLSPHVKTVIRGSLKELESSLFQDVINTLDTTPFTDQRVIIKGCSKLPIPESAFVAITHKLKPVVKSIMYGEACSSVPIYKKK